MDIRKSMFYQVVFDLRSEKPFFPLLVPPSHDRYKPGSVKTSMCFLRDLLIQSLSFLTVAPLHNTEEICPLLHTQSHDWLVSLRERV